MKLAAEQIRRLRALRSFHAHLSWPSSPELEKVGSFQSSQVVGCRRHTMRLRHPVADFQDTKSIAHGISCVLHLIEIESEFIGITELKVLTPPL